MRINLVTPFAEKDAVKALGAKWDSSRKVWYVVDVPDLTPFRRWLPGEGAGLGGVGNMTRAARERSSSMPKVTEDQKFAPLCSCDVLPWEDCEHTRSRS